MNENRINLVASLFTEEAMNFIRTHRIKDGDAIIVMHHDASKPKMMLVCIGNKLFKFKYKSCINIIGESDKEFIEDMKISHDYSLNVIREISGTLNMWNAYPSTYFSAGYAQAAIFACDDNGVYVCDNRDIFFTCDRLRTKFEFTLRNGRDKFWINYFDPENYFKDYSLEDGTFIPLRQRIEQVSFEPKKDLVADSPLLVQYTAFPNQLEKYSKLTDKPETIVANKLFYKSKNGIEAYNLRHKKRLFIPSDIKLEKRMKLGAYITTIAACSFDTRVGTSSMSMVPVVININNGIRCYVLDIYTDTGYVSFDNLSEAYPEENKFGDKYREFLKRWYGSGMIIFE